MSKEGTKANEKFKAREKTKENSFTSLYKINNESSPYENFLEELQDLCLRLTLPNSEFVKIIKMKSL